MANEQLKIQIVLDDGSVTQGFLNLEKQAKKTSDKVASNFDSVVGELGDIAPEFASKLSSASGLIEKFLTSPLGAATAAVTVLAGEFKFLLDNTLAGEKLIKIEKQFDSLASSVGVSGEQLKTNFLNSLDGLVDDSDAIQSLNKAFVNLGDKVQQLPEVMLLARKATNQFGGDVIDNFEKINQAISSGATRSLRTLGINLDATKSYKAYADQLGITTDQLTEAGRQQAILNSLLEINNTKFKNISPTIGGAGTALQRLSVSMENIKETFEIFIAKNYGGFFADLFEAIDSGLKKLTGNFGESDRIREVSSEIENLQNKVFGLQALQFSGKSTLFNSEELRKSQEQLKILNDEYSKLTAKASTVASSGNDIGSISSGGGGSSSVSTTRKQREEELTKFIQQQNISRLQAGLVEVSQVEDAALQINAIQQREKQQLEILEAQHQQKLLDIKTQFAASKGFTEQQRQLAESALNQSAEAERIRLEQEVANKILDIKKKAAKDAIVLQEKTDSIQFDNLKSSLSTIATLQESSSKELQTIGKAAAISTATIDGYAAVQKALASAPPPFNFAIAAAVGVAAAANIAKIASVGGGGGGSGFSVSDSGGGIATTPSASTELTPTQDLTRSEPQTAVSVVIQGDILDSDESGSRIVALINQAFDKKGVVINQGVMA